MEISYTPLEERLKEAKAEARKKYSFHRKAEKLFNFIESLPWSPEESTLTCDVSCFIVNRVTIMLDNVTVEDAIENLLGPIHRKYGIEWKMEIYGDEHPMFEFTLAGRYFSWLEVKVKEGKFKQCKVIKKVKDVRDLGTAINYSYHLECE